MTVREFIDAVGFAFFIALPFVIYFLEMKP